LVLKIIGISESTYYYNKQPKEGADNKYNSADNTGGRPIPGYSLDQAGTPTSDEQIKEWLLELISGEEEIYGYRKLTKCLRSQHQLVINKKKVYRLCKELGILKKQRQIMAKHPRRLARNRTITNVNQLWEIDIKYGYIAGEDRFFYLMSIIDVYDRVIVDYHIGLTCEGRHAAHIVERALRKRKLINNTAIRPVIRTDNGPQFISNIFEIGCQTLSVEHERIPPKTPNLNAHIESFHSILERDCYAKNEFISYTDAHKTVTEFIDFYVNRYLHGSLNDMPPTEFHRMVVNNTVTPFTVKV
jgi:putative transposase